MYYKIKRKGKSKNIVVEFHLDDYESNNAAPLELRMRFHKFSEEIPAGIFKLRLKEQE